MPPKKVDKKSEKGQLKALEKQKAKIAEDKTFGLKNKNKSKAVQKLVKQVQSQIKGTNNVSEQVLRQREHEAREQKKRESQRQALLASLTRGTQNIAKITVAEAAKTTPQSIKAGQQIDLYTDQRDVKARESMENWDLEKLQEVIKSKHGQGGKQQVDIVCKHFLDAVERRTYGWFWSCPNGGDACKYRHSLPPGYVLKPKGEPTIVEEDEDPLEDRLEAQRAQLKGEGTKVTEETFRAWKLRKEQERKDRAEAERLAAEKRPGVRDPLSGRDLFSFDPSLFVDDAAAAADLEMQGDEEYWAEEEKEQREQIGRRGEEGESSADESDGDGDDGEDGDGDGAGDAAASSAATSAGAAGAAAAKQTDVGAAADVFITQGKEALFLDENADVDLDELSD